MSRIIFLIVLAAIYLAVDIYSYNGLKNLVGQSRTYNIIYWTVTIGFFAGLLFTFRELQGFKGIRPLWLNLIIGLVFTIFITKLIYGSLFLLYDIGRLFTGGVQWVGAKTGALSISEEFIPKRRKLIAGIITGITAIPFLGMLHGITKGKYNYQVNKVLLKFPDLPEAFDGFKLVQISDIHSGSYDSYDQVMKGIHMINDLEPDVLVFTGDLVNSHKDEIDPYVSAFAQAKAKEGKFSITGNHDYYGIRSSENKDDYWNDFQWKHQEMGFDLIMNSNRTLTRKDQSIRIVGVENWGLGPFPKEGDLDKALRDVDGEEFTVLLSHDPTHWDEHALKHSKHIHLTLSGHTHGMQFGISALGIKWSPIKYRYKKWAGLYTEKEQHLYVNKGFGFLGLPGRIGMFPEITEFTFEKA